MLGSKNHDYDVELLTPTRSSLRETELSTISSCVSDPSESSATKLAAWVYWQRDSEHNPRCWTKVFAVLRNEFLWLHRRPESAPKSVLLQLAVMSVEVSGKRQLRIVDPNGEDLTLCLLSDDDFESWRASLQFAAVRTDEYFRRASIDVTHLPSDSFFRGTLVAYRQPSKRQRCMAAISKLARRRHRED